MPAGVYNPYPRQVQPQRQRVKPFDHIAMHIRRMFDLFQKAGMLPTVFLALFVVAITQIFAFLLRMRCMPANGIQFMIAHDRERRAILYHGSHDVKRAQLVRSPVDQIADKDGLSFRMSPSAWSNAVTHFLQQRFQLARLSMEITDDVVRHAKPLKLTCRILQSVYASLIRTPILLSVPVTQYQ